MRSLTWLLFKTCSFRYFRQLVMIWYVFPFRFENYSFYSASWDTLNWESILADFRRRSWSLLNLLRCFLFYHIKWWYVTCFVPWSFNRSAKLFRSDVVGRLMKTSVRYLGGCLLLIETFKTYWSNRVCLLTLLVPVMVFIVFVISLYLCRYPFSPYSCRILKVKWKT